ncbi:unannotated protein [freshwater metagenome]|uniref:Unannotated protein n=1 Tax=freshwater metagenome TaxID=449393 RepID=A0A6J6WR19_9ZZZZ
MGTSVDTSKHPLHLGHEAHVGHAVGFVQHENVELRNIDFTAVTQVNQATGGGDDDVSTLADVFDLTFDIGSAVDRNQAQTNGLTEWLENIEDLNG